MLQNQMSDDPSERTKHRMDERLDNQLQYESVTYSQYVPANKMDQLDGLLDDQVMFAVSLGK